MVNDSNNNDAKMTLKLILERLWDVEKKLGISSDRITEIRSELNELKRASANYNKRIKDPESGINDLLPK